MSNSLKTKETEYLCKAFMSLENEEECFNLLCDLCSAAEIEEMGRRMTAAKMLVEGEKYNNVAAATGLSTATISRVNRCIKYGNDGYTAVLSRMVNKK